MLTPNRSFAVATCKRNQRFRSHLQEKSDNFSEYSERTEALAGRLRANLSDLPGKIGISAAMFYAYRTGKYPISLKAWRKLEAAEKAAGLTSTDRPPDTRQQSSFAVRDAEVEYRASPKTTFSRLDEISGAVASLQQEIDSMRLLANEYSLGDLISRMQASGAWPPSPEDAKLSPSLLMLKYALPTTPEK